MKNSIILLALMNASLSLAQATIENSKFPDEQTMEMLNQEALDKSVAVNAGGAFNYQGELNDAGVAVSGQYDFSFSLWNALAGGTKVAGPAIKGNRTVTNGLFNIEDLDFGVVVYDGQALWLEVTVRETGNPGSETTLSPRQSIASVPYAVQADYLASNGASNGDFLQFDGADWVPATVTPGASPWNIAGSTINYLNNVGIGSTADFDASLRVVSSGAFNSVFEGGQDMYIGFYENGVARGYIGSFVSGSAGSNIKDEDFEIGTYGSNNIGGLQFTIQNTPKMTIDHSGKVGIGSTAPLADLFVDAISDGDAFRVRVDATTKLVVNDNGGTYIGKLGVPPVDGLAVLGRTTLLDETDAALTNGSGALVVGIESGLNLVMDGNELMARNNASTSPLLLQHDGGQVRINEVSGASDASLAIYGSGALVIGNSTTSNLVFDNSEIMARNNGISSTLYLQADSGLDLDIGSSDGLVNIGGTSGFNMSIDANDIQVRSNGVVTDLFLNYDGGNVHVGSSATTTAATGLKVYGQIFVDGSVIHTSDKRLKKDIENLSYGLAEVMVLEPKAYKWKNHKQEDKSFGLIAQEVQKIMPELVTVSNDEEQTLGLSYTELVPVLVNAIQEQQAIIDEQNRKIEKLIKMIGEIK